MRRELPGREPVLDQDIIHLGACLLDDQVIVGRLAMFAPDELIGIVPEILIYRYANWQYYLFSFDI